MKRESVPDSNRDGNDLSKVSRSRSRQNFSFPVPSQVPDLTTLVKTVLLWMEHVLGAINQCNIVKNVLILMVCIAVLNVLVVNKLCNEISLYDSHYMRYANEL